MGQKKRKKKSLYRSLWSSAHARHRSAAVTATTLATAMDSCSRQLKHDCIHCHRTDAVIKDSRGSNETKLMHVRKNSSSEPP